MQDESVLAAPPDTPDESAPVVGPAGHVGGLVVVAIILRPSSSDSGTTVNRGLGRYSGNAFVTGRRGPSPPLPATRPGRAAPGSAPLGATWGQSRVSAVGPPHWAASDPGPAPAP